MSFTLRRAVGTQLISYFVPNGTKGVMRGGFYQYCVPTGLTRQMQKKQYKLRLMFALYYGCGLRLSAGCKLQIKDVDFDKKTVFVEQRKP